MTSLVTRRLALVRKIAEISTIAHSRHYAVAKVDGWNVVTHRSEGFSEGQMVLYIEIDSILPNSGPFWEYHVSNSQTTDNQSLCLVRTTIIRKHLSQGLLFPLSRFPQIVEEFDHLKSNHSLEEAERILMTKSFADSLGIKKYVPLGTYARSTNSLGRPPVFIQQPGSNRVQDICNLFRDMGHLFFQVTEKLDGVPMSVYMVQPDSQWWSGLPILPGAGSIYKNMSTRVGVCGRWEDYGEDDNCEFWKAAKSQGIIDGIKQLCGSSILSNSMGFPSGKHHFYVFDIYDIDKQAYLRPKTVVRSCMEAHWDHVPIILHHIKLSTFAKDIEDLLKKAEGNGVLGQMREGLVFKSLEGRHTFKAISNPWLLATGKEPAASF
ncbi:RNA ligase, DRB0094 family [Xylariaceae sp. FL1651]|nr:RNA ligase, DRB0094 family [Xylariaceae sp. FL1651]